MNSVLQPLPLASENPFSSEQECIDQIGAHAHHSSFAAGVPDQLRRDGALSHSSTGILNSLSSGTAGRYRGHRPEAHTYQPGTAISGSDSGSISTSPSSNTSSLAFTSFSPTATNVNSYQVANNYPSSYQSFSPFAMARPSRMSSITDSPATAMLPPTRSPGMGNPVSPPLGASTRDNYTTATSGMGRHLHSFSPHHSEVPRYSTLPDTSRSLLSTTMPMSMPDRHYNVSAVTSALAYHPNERHTETPPFNAQQNFCEITCEGKVVVPNIEAKIEKGFFYSNDSVWTCYRRNYFAVNVSFGLSPFISGVRLYLNQGSNKGHEQIQSMAVSLAAAVDGSTGKSIELIQHTPKRDKGPQLQMKKELLAPMPPGKTHTDHSYNLAFNNSSAIQQGPLLPLQNEHDHAQTPYSPAGHSGAAHQHSFERIQFKSATANNGKRRAQQQYYHLIVELWANVQSTRDTEPRWVKVATRSSAAVVVRGRSPSHYQNEGPHNAGASRNGGGPGLGGSGHHGLGSNGGPTYGTSYRNGMSGGGSTGMSGSVYRSGGNTYSMDPSPIGSHSVSSASSLSGGPVEGFVGDQHMVDDDEAKPNAECDGYQYFPHPIYDSNMPTKLEPSALPLPGRRIKEEYPGSATVASNIPSTWPVGGCGRFQGMESSRGYYPDVHVNAGY